MTSGRLPQTSEVQDTKRACGKRPPGVRVVNGVDAAPHSWPWQISLRVNGGHICGGSLIRPDWVVTAAHCVQSNPNPSGYTVVVGAHVRTGTTAAQETFNLKQVISHESYSSRNLRNDIALLQLDRPATLSDKVNTICLPAMGDRVAVGSKCYITGWGRTVGGGAAANVLQQAMLPVQSHSSCTAKNGHLVPVHENSMVCAGSGMAGQAGGCQGDSGGPFVCEEGGKWVLRGAVSWGNGMCLTSSYTVFARVSSFIDWINQKISGGSGGNGGGSGGSGGGGGCVDKHGSCPQVSSYCWHKRIKDLCPKTCRTCSGGSGGGSICVDENQYCKYLVGHCSSNAVVRMKCKKSCRVC